MINKIKSSFFVLLCVVIFFPSCEIEEVQNPNGPTLESLENGASLADLRLLATGLQAAMRNDMEYHFWTTSMVGREYYDLNGIDPRYTGELIGAGGGILDNNGFLTTRAFASAYYIARNAYTLSTAARNSAASLTQQQENGIIGFAETMRAYGLSLEANRQYNNGIRLDTSDPNNPGAFAADYQASMIGVAAILDEANDLLGNAGEEFIFNLSPGLADFSTPATFRQFNRALAARIAIYRGDDQGALQALENSFFDLEGDINTGAYYSFGAGGNDRLNPLFNVAATDLYMAHDSFVEDAEDNDNRLSKVTLLESTDDLTVPVCLDDLCGSYQVTMYDSNVDPVPMIRNEELILIYAEANLRTENLGEAETAINFVRQRADIGNYGGDSTPEALTDELLHQRRYSLFGEGHRWVDMRRYGRLGALPIDRDGDQVFESFPRPILEGF